MRRLPPKASTSWDPVGGWYDRAVGEKGHYHHQTIILPNALRMLNFPALPLEASLLDLACGQGILCRQLPEHVSYVGVDLAEELLAAARRYQPQHQFIHADATKKLPVQKKDFTHAAIMLALQNMEEPAKLIHNAAKHLRAGGRFLIVLNHPCFRIPRQSSWGVDEKSDIQYRRIDRYMSPMKIPIQAHPGKGKESPQTWSFHHPLSSFSAWLKDAGFAIEAIEEWCSTKSSEGGAAKRENRSRDEIPLFMAILAQKT